MSHSVTEVGVGARGTGGGGGGVGGKEGDRERKSADTSRLKCSGHVGDLVE